MEKKSSGWKVLERAKKNPTHPMPKVALPKTTKKQPSQDKSDWEKYLWYKFELLKRNEDYRRDFQQLSKAELHQKWGIDKDPHLPSDKVKILFPLRYVTEEAAIAKRFFEDLLSITLVQDNKRKPIRIDISINPEAPWNVIEERLKSALTSDNLWGDRSLTDRQWAAIDEAIQSGDEDKAAKLEKMYCQRKQLPKKKIDPKVIEQVLEIYDLRYSNKKSIEEIAESLFPEENLNSSIRKVNRYLEKARKMISTGKLW